MSRDTLLFLTKRKTKQKLKLVNLRIKGTVTQKVLLIFMIENGVYNAINVKFYMYIK